MDIIDNIIYANLFSELKPTGSGDVIISDYIDAFGPPQEPNKEGTPDVPIYTYDTSYKLDYCSYRDPSTIESSALRHWYDIDEQVTYSNGTGDVYAVFSSISPYHLIYAYLLENTRILQIFERFIEKYLRDEEFGIADNSLVYHWIQNSERLFFKNDSPLSSNLRSIVRPSLDATRRNAYWRMFGMDLAFGDINSTNGTLNYYKAKSSNQQFIALFEKYLSEIWQGYINARNSSGANTSDINIVCDLATQIREMLIARRGDSAANTYAALNLSREEFSAVLITSWFTFIISDNTPVVEFLNCQSSTIGERLLKIGAKVGVPAHGKCQSLFEMSSAASTILTTIEVGGYLDDDSIMQDILSSLNPGGTPASPEYPNYMTDLLTLINNWEKATGHRIKNPEANVRGTVTVAQPKRTNGKAVEKV